MTAAKVLKVKKEGRIRNADKKVSLVEEICLTYAKRMSLIEDIRDYHFHGILGNTMKRIEY